MSKSSWTFGWSHQIAVLGYSALRDSILLRLHVVPKKIYIHMVLGWKEI
jgi:hypothetical protein